MNRVYVWHPGTGETLFLGLPGDAPLAPFVIEQREPMPNGGEVVVRFSAPRRYVADDFAPPASAKAAFHGE